MRNILWCTGHSLKIPDIVRAEGSFIYDGRGNRYMDLESGVWVVPLGHNYPGVNQAINDQLSKLTHCGYYNSSSIVNEAALAVLGITGLEDGKCIFLCSGSEAVECGIQAIHKITGKTKLLCLHDSFLGSYGAASKKRQEEWHLLDWTGCRSCSQSERCDPDCHLFSAIPFKELGGFVFEPGSASGLVRFPPCALIEKMVSKIRDHGGKILVNEVTTGLGRSGQWFGYNHYQLKPDLVAMGKGIGNGYPVSVLAISQDAARKLEEKSFYYQQSHQNDALGCRVALAVIDELDKENLIERCSELGIEFLKHLNSICRKYPFVRDIRGKGFMIAIEFSGAGDQPAVAIHDQLIKKGFITSLRRGHNSLRIDPPLNIKKEYLAEFTTGLDSVLSSTC